VRGYTALHVNSVGVNLPAERSLSLVTYLR
jgi:hypothetical protein